MRTISVHGASLINSYLNVFIKMDTRKKKIKIKHALATQRKSPLATQMHFARGKKNQQRLTRLNMHVCLMSSQRTEKKKLNDDTQLNRTLHWNSIDRE